MADEPGDCTCGGSIPAGRRDGFCSSWCRSRDERGLEPSPPPPRFTSSTVMATGEPPAAARGASAQVAVLATPPAAAPGGDEPKRPSYRLRRRKIADEVEERLRAAGMVDTWQGAAALDLADALDWSGGSGSARAALHRELNRQMSELLRGQDEAGSRVGAMRDELEARRARRAGGDG